MPRTIRAKVQGLAVVLVFFIAYYLFLFDLAIMVKDNIVSYLSSNGLASITIPVKKWNETSKTWVETAYTFDLSGFIDIVMTIALIIAPIAVLYRYLL
jgi:Fe2+ transport system protein B